MQEYDVIKIETDSMTNLIGEVVQEVLQKKKGYRVDLQIHALNVVNDDVGTRIHFDLEAETDTGELKKICKDFDWKIGMIPLVLKMKDILFPRKHYPIENMVKDWLTEKYGIQINGLKYHEEEKRVYASLNADLKVKREEIEKFLEKAGLI